MTAATDAHPRREADGWRILRLDRYIFAASARPFLITLGVVLIALLLERVLRLFDLLAQTSVSMPVVAQLAANLVPHYLGLALPAAFFVSVFSVAGRLDDNNEMDALMAGGLSIGRITRPFLMIGAVAMVFSIVLFGFIQPYSRYAYRAIFNAASHAAWDGRAQAATFVDTPRGIVLSADGVDPSGTRLTGVFLRERLVSGGERITTAKSGLLAPNTTPNQLTLYLQNGQSVEDTPGTTRPQIVIFENLATSLPYAVDQPPFRARGEDEREMTLLELLQGMNGAPSPAPPAAMAAEFHGRLARALSLPLLPLLAMPLALVAKRARRGAGLVLAGVILFGYQHALQFGASLAETGRAAALPAIWIPFTLFAGFCLWLFLSSRDRPGDNPLGRITASLDNGLALLGRLIHRKRKLVE